MHGLIRLLSILSFFWILSTLQNISHASSYTTLSSHHFKSHTTIASDSIQHKIHSTNDLSANSFSALDSIGILPDGLIKIFLISSFQSFIHTAQAIHKIYLFFPTGPSPPHSLTS